MGKIEPVRFLASLPPIKSALLLDGSGDGGQVKLEVDRSQVGALLLIQQYYSGCVFRVTIEADDAKPRTTKNRQGDSS